MAANDGPVPVRTLAHAARLMREARQLGLYGIRAGEPHLDYQALLARAKEVVGEVREHSTLRRQIEAAGTIVRENEGRCRFVDAHSVEAPSGERFSADRIIICTGGEARRLTVPGAELVASHSGAWSLTEIPASMIVVGGGATGLQVASIFAAFGTSVELFETAARFLANEDEDVAAAVAQGFRQRGIVIHEGVGSIDRFERTEGGVRMHYSDASGQLTSEAALAVAAIGWGVDGEALNLSAAGIVTDDRGYIRVDEHCRTSAPDIYAAGDVIGGVMLAPQAMQEGFLAASAALGVPERATARHLAPIGSFTDPEYARVGLTESEARSMHGVVSASVSFAEASRPIIDGRAYGFCKLVADRSSRQILGCGVVGDRAVDIVQVAAVAMAAGMRVDELGHFPLSFPIYAGVLSQAAAKMTYLLNRCE
jgi:dihydrolipoamide dehydrogenase